MNNNKQVLKTRTLNKTNSNEMVMVPKEQYVLVVSELNELQEQFKAAQADRSKSVVPSPSGQEVTMTRKVYECLVADLEEAQEQLRELAEIIGRW